MYDFGVYQDLDFTLQGRLGNCPDHPVSTSWREVSNVARTGHNVVDKRIDLRCAAQQFLNP